MPSETSLPRLTARKAKNKQHSFTGFTQWNYVDIWVIKCLNKKLNWV